MNISMGVEDGNSLFVHCCFWGSSHAPVDLVKQEKEATPASPFLFFVQEGGESSASILTGVDISCGRGRKGVSDEI